MIPVYTEEDEKRFNKVLREIQSRIPPMLLKNAIEEKALSPTIELVLNKALESETIDDEKKTHIRNALLSGEFSRKGYAENPKYTKMIDNFVNREINKAQKEGRLPPKSHVKYLPSVIKRNEAAQTIA